MVERWNIGFQKDISHFNFSANPVGGGAINPTLHYPRTHYSTIPVFHHSPPPADERSELSSFKGEIKTAEDFIRLSASKSLISAIGK